MYRQPTASRKKKINNIFKLDKTNLLYWPVARKAQQFRTESYRYLNDAKRHDSFLFDEQTKIPFTV